MMLNLRGVRTWLALRIRKQGDLVCSRSWNIGLSLWLIFVENGVPSLFWVLVWRANFNIIISFTLAVSRWIPIVSETRLVLPTHIVLIVVAHDRGLARVVLHHYWWHTTLDGLLYLSLVMILIISIIITLVFLRVLGGCYSSNWVKLVSSLLLFRTL